MYINAYDAKFLYKSVNSSGWICCYVHKYLSCEMVMFTVNNFLGYKQLNCAHAIPSIATQNMSDYMQTKLSYQQIRQLTLVIICSRQCAYSYLCENQQKVNFSSVGIVVFQNAIIELLKQYVLYSDSYEVGEEHGMRMRMDSLSKKQVEENGCLKTVHKPL